MDSSLDAVVIATPQHAHAAQFGDALASGKHVYVEKTLALTVAQAKQMRAAYQKDGGRRTVQVGHQACSTGHLTDVRQFLSQPDRMGQILVQTLREQLNPRGASLMAFVMMGAKLDP